MGRGKKLNIFIGADFNDGWTEIQSPRKSKVNSELLEPAKHLLHFAKEKRRGKVVTLVGPFQLSKENAATLLKNLKKKLGCGGSYKEHFMEFQGEPKEKLRELLTKEDFRFKNGH